MATSALESIERKLGVPGKLLIAPVFILLLFAFVTYYCVREFQILDERMNTVARDLAPDTATATEALIDLYRMRLRVFDYYSTGNSALLSSFDELEEDFSARIDAAQKNIQNLSVPNSLMTLTARCASTLQPSKMNWYLQKNRSSPLSEMSWMYPALTHRTR
ncbi:hypothetical protein [Marinobacter similis]|uniref:hypothetical protein n=1 Tax=Marinobacter similis TaxID=1420916 RepID=UPI001F481224|nr:hypothetical protein [Marinobacter similis]